MTTWTTEAVKPSDRFAFWREVVCQTVLNVSTEAPPQQFWARISGQSFGAMRFAAFDSSGHEIVRSKEHLSNAPADTYLISLQRKGRCHITQGSDDEFLLDPGEIAIVDGEEPFRVAFPSAVSRVLAVVPKNVLDTRAPWLRKMTQRKIHANSSYAEMVRLHLLKLANSHDLAEGEVNLLTDNLCNLLVLSFGRETSTGKRSPEPQVAAIIAFCRANLANPDLAPDMAAARFGISVRTLHLRFRDVGQTFGQWLIENRLEAIRVALRDPLQLHTTISDIAYRWGFSDLSHFNKAFRLRFGHTPREWRRYGVLGALGISQ
jgi:AraC family transcriptional regulator, positive regulator of tynA and feaB